MHQVASAGLQGIWKWLADAARAAASCSRYGLHVSTTGRLTAVECAIVVLASYSSTISLSCMPNVRAQVWMSLCCGNT